MDRPNLSVGYVNVFVNQFDECLDFFSDKLGFTPVTLDRQFGYASFNTGTISFAIVATDDDSLVGRHTGVAFLVTDVDEAFQALTARGVKFAMDPTDQPWGGRIALMLDPVGNVYYLDVGHESGDV